MSFFSKYRLRIIIFLLGLLIFSSISFVSVITLDVQQNISVIEEKQVDFLNEDNILEQQISNNLEFLSSLLRNEIFNNFQLLLNNQTGSNPFRQADLVTSTIEMRNKANIRQARDYAIVEGLINPGIFDYGLLGNEFPDFSGIINRNSTGVLDSIEEFLNGLSGPEDDTLANVLDQLGEERDDYFVLINQLQTTNSELRDNNQQLTNATVDFWNTLNDTAYTEIQEDQLPNFEYYMNSIANLHSQLQSNIINSLNPNVNNIVSQFETTKNDTLETLESINTTLNSIGAINTTNAELAFDTVFTEATEVIDGYSSITQDYSEYVSIVNTINERQSVAVNEILTPSVDLLNATIGVLNMEQAEFREHSNAYIQTLRSDLISITSVIFYTIIGLTLLAFTYIIYMFTRGIGRITAKNERFAEGNLNITKRESYANNELGHLENSIDTAVLQMRAILTSVKQTSETLAGISEELAAGAEEASASINDVSSTVREFSAGSSEQNIMLNRVREELLQHLDVVEKTATQIDETANFVLQVAKRTNILGLNASIEAAKAGRFGLGFEVVAEEVRNLSTETKTSASRIADNIEEIEFNIKQTIEDVLREVDIIREVAENTAAGSEEASAATSEQVTMMNEISDTSAQLSDLSQTLNNLMKEFNV